MGNLEDKISKLLEVNAASGTELPKPKPKKTKKSTKQSRAEAKFNKELAKRPVGRPRGRAKRTTSGKGYSYVWVDGKQVTEQRYLMEQKLKRKLLPHEAVFFIDGDKTNLSLDNLKLGPKPGYKGDILCPNCNCNVYQ